ncbi:restriction endonuclease subunit S domain-containing protein [Mycolicibacterium neoaurum]|uniref:restriction endonuclease subunit S n=1 Tax=Mycolicibacterium neoaurum TaxID=1795 RepID=UPI0010FDFCCC|nr:restriction endonuclease subunit S [Mycolicibacterium neoaurum]
MANGDEKLWQLEAPNELGFARRDAPSEAELIASVNSILETQPAVVIPPWDRRPGEQMDRHEAVALSCTARPKPHGLTMVFPAFSLVSSRGETFRRRFFEAWEPTTVAYIAGGLTGVHPSFRTAVVSVLPRTDESRLLRMFETPPGWVTGGDDVFSDMCRLLRMDGGSTQFGYVLRQQPEAGVRLGFRDLDPRIARRRDGLREYGDAATLGAVFHISRARLRPTDLVRDHRNGAVRVISGRDIRSDGTISPTETDPRWTHDNDQPLFAGDIVVRALRHPTDRRGFIWARISDDDLPAVANTSVITLRSKHLLSPLAEAFVLEYLRSPLSTALGTEQSGSTINVSHLADLPVPLPDHDMETAMAAVHHALNRADEWRQEAADLLDSVFDDPTAAASRIRILTESRRLRSKIEAAEAVDDFGHRVRTLYPHPIALRWRRIEANAASSSETNDNLYREILQAAEVLLAYLANIALALARECNLPVGAVTNIRENLGRGHGPGLGDWVAVLDEISGRRFSPIDQLIGLSDLREFVGKDDVSRALRALRNRRNDESHVRGVDALELPTATAEARNELIVLLTAADFIVDLPLILAESDEWDELSNEGRVTFRQLSGDHAVVPAQVMRSDRRVERHSLYLLDAERRLHLLRPFLIAMQCPICRNPSTFHIDRLTSTGIDVKSLEDGHTTARPDLQESLQRAGIISNS